MFGTASPNEIIQDLEELTPLTEITKVTRNRSRSNALYKEYENGEIILPLLLIIRSLYESTIFLKDKSMSTATIGSQNENEQIDLQNNPFVGEKGNENRMSRLRKMRRNVCYVSVPDNGGEEVLGSAATERGNDWEEQSSASQPGFKTRLIMQCI